MSSFCTVYLQKLKYEAAAKIIALDMDRNFL